MKNLPKNSKISLFKKTWVSAQQDAKSANKKALEAGKILSEIKEENIGSWTKFVEVELDGFIGIRQADKLIKCYENKLLISLVSNNEPLTINAMIKIIAEADHEQLAQVEQLKKEEELAEIAKLQAAELAKAKKDDVIDGVFEEVKKPAPVPAPQIEEEFTEVEELQGLLHEQHSVAKALQEDNDSLVKIFESSDQITQALKELHIAKEINRGLEGRINGFMVETRELKKAVNYWKSRCKKLGDTNV